MVIKLRVWGEKTDIQAFARLLHSLEVSGHVRVLNESSDYADRAPSAYSRRYLEVDVRKP